MIYLSILRPITFILTTIIFSMPTSYWYVDIRNYRVEEPLISGHNIEIY